MNPTIPNHKEYDHHDIAAHSCSCTKRQQYMSRNEHASRSKCSICVHAREQNACVFTFYLNSNVENRLEHKLNIYEEYREKTLKGRLQKRRDPRRCSRPPNPLNISYGRHWGVVRRAMIWSFRILTWKVRRARNSWAMGFGLELNVKCVIIAAVTKPRGFWTTVCPQTWPYDHEIFVHLRGT